MFFSKFTFIFYECSRVSKKLLKWGGKKLLIMWEKTFHNFTSSNYLLWKRHVKTQRRDTNNFRDCHNREGKYSVETGNLQIFRHIFKSVRNTVVIIKSFAIQKISSKYFQRMNLIGFQEFSARAPLLQLIIFFQIWTFFKVMTLILYEFFLWNWEKCGWLREINKLFL